MGVYLITVLVASLFCYLAEKKDVVHVSLSEGRVNHSRSARNFFVLAALLLTIVSGLRYFVGSDYGIYYYNFYKYSEMFASSLQTFDEPGIKFICWIFHRITTDGAVPIFVYSAITIGLSMYIIYRYTDKLLVATMLFIFLGCWHVSFNAVRQCIAAAIVFCGYNYLRERKFLKYTLIILLAFLFHRSAAIMIMLYFISSRKVDMINIIVLSIISFIALNSYDFILGFTSELLVKDLSGDTVYINTQVNIFRTLVAIAPAVYFMFLYRNKEKTKSEDFYLNLLIFHGLLMLMSANSAYLARIGIYTAPFSCIAIPELNKINGRNQKVINIIILGLFFIFWIYDLSMFSFSNVTFDWIWNR